MDPAPQEQLRREMPEVAVLGAPEELAAIVLQEAVDEVFVALPLRSCFDEWLRVQRFCGEVGVPVHFDLDWCDPRRARFGRRAGRALVTCHVHPAARPAAAAAKRLIDVLGAAAALVLTAPILAATALLVKLSSPGPVLFRQPRVGRHRRVFAMLKFRTMVADAEATRGRVQTMNAATGFMFKVAADPRVTRVGHWLRRTSIDELPQLLNVLKGDMSLVGPRPVPVWVFDSADEQRFHRRFSVMPGMTGLWQVNGREQHAALMTRYDLEYVDRWSLWLDLKILCRTIPVVLSGRGGW